MRLLGLRRMIAGHTGRLQGRIRAVADGGMWALEAKANGIEAGWQW